MKTSWNETKQIEDHLHQSAHIGDTLLFEAKLLLDPALHEKMLWQQKTYNIIHACGRQQLKQEIEAVHQKLFSSPGHSRFRQKIRLLFINR